MTVENKQLAFTSDKPVIEDKLGTHKHLANLLIQISKSESDNPLVVGLFGGWGTGKSSIVKIYNDLCSQHDIKNIYIDSWGFANAKERFGAGFLKQLADSLLNSFTRDGIVRKINQRFEQWDTIFDLGSGTWRLLLSTLMIFLGSVYMGIWLIGSVDKPEFDLFIFMITTVIVNGLLNWVLPKIMVTYESRTVDESYNKIEHFRSLFQQILKSTQYEKISVVVDNLDRVEPSDALEMIRMLKTFVSEEILEGKRFVLIVPCDEQELATHIEKQLYVGDAHEFLRKFFSITVFVPELVHEDIVSFTKKEFERVSKNLVPSLSEEDEDLVSFVISRAARKNPRQVKILINSFIGYWQSAGLVGSISTEKFKGISALGAVIYVCLLYMRKDKEIPRQVNEAFDEKLNSNDEDLKKFIISIKEFQSDIKELEWSYLRRLQVSDNERAIPNFVDIYFAVTDKNSNWNLVDELITDKHDLKDLIKRLEIKIRDDDNSVSRQGLNRWVLSLIARGRINFGFLPLSLRTYIDFNLLQPIKQWQDLIDEGLAEYIIQSHQLNSNLSKTSSLFKILTTFNESLKPEEKKPAHIKFVSRLVYSVNTDFWTRNPNEKGISGVLDKIVFHFISTKNDKLLSSVIKNIGAVFSEETGSALADEVVNLDEKQKDIIFKNHNIFSKKEDFSYVGPYKFATKWLERTYSSQGENHIPITFYCISLLYNSTNPNLFQKKILGDYEFRNFVDRIENTSRSLKHPDTSLLILLSISLLAYLMQIIESRSQYDYTIRSLKNQIWPSFIQRYEQLSESSKKYFLEHLDKHKDFIHSIAPHELAILSQYDEINILSRIYNLDILKSTFEDLSKLNHFGKAIDYWIKNNLALVNSIEDLNNNLNLGILFQAIESKAIEHEKYKELFPSIYLINQKIDISELFRGHFMWILDNIKWKDKSSVENNFRKMWSFEKIIQFDNEIKDKIRNELHEDTLVLLSDDIRLWIRNHLK